MSRRTVGSSPGLRLGAARYERTALESRDDNARAEHGIRAQVRDPNWQGGPDLPVSPPVGNAAVACTLVDGAGGSNLSRVGEQTRC